MIRNRTTFSVILLCAFVAPMAAAQDKKTPSSPSLEQPSAGRIDEKLMALMQENVKLMQQKIESIRHEKNSRKRYGLLREHMQLMQKNMKMMRGMDAIGDSSGKMGPGMGATDPSAREQVIERRIDMMYSMMEQMLLHQEMADHQMMMPPSSGMRKATASAF